MDCTLDFNKRKREQKLATECMQKRNKSSDTKLGSTTLMHEDHYIKYFKRILQQRAT